jgi:hypothetical protein
MSNATSANTHLAIVQNRAPTPAAPPATSTVPSPQAQTICNIPGVTDVRTAYRAAVAERNELRTQQGILFDQRRPFADRARAGNAAAGPDQKGINDRIAEFDGQLATIGTQLVASNAKVACLAGVPGAVSSPPPGGPNSDDLAIAGLFLSALLAAPLVIAWSRRIWRRGAQLVPFMPRELEERLSRIEQSVESVAIEVERVGEGQRFVTNLIAQNGVPRAIGAAAMEPVEVQQRERVAQERFDR